ncbi:MAG: Crp/Fnr family transcriptional regulator [Cytophagales bacterium]|nr:Crp/Fnr family transcriptional regulator [Cytophagales bacterium]
MTQFVNGYRCLDCNHCFKKSQLFALLNESELDFLNDARLEVRFKKGEIIYKQGTPLTHIVILNEGLGKIYLEGDKGRNLILNYTKKYELNGGVGVFLDQRHYSSLMAVTDCGACFIEIGAFKNVLRSNATFMEAYIKAYSQRVLHTYQQFAVLTQKNMEGRIAESILFLNDRIFQNGIIKNVSNQDLAELTAMTKESAIRVLKEFKEDGIIEIVDHSINILDQKALQQVAAHG